MVQEYIYYLTHRYLYPPSDARSGRWQDLIEGIIECLTRTTSNEVVRIRTSYETLYYQVNGYVGSDTSKRQAVIQCCLAGEA